MTPRQAGIGIAAILGLAAVAMCWLALASAILCFRQHLFAYVEWPQAAFLWWDTYDEIGLTDSLRSAAWFSAEILAVLLIIIGGNLLRNIPRRPFGLWRMVRTRRR